MANNSTYTVNTLDGREMHIEASSFQITGAAVEFTRDGKLVAAFNPDQVISVIGE